MLSACALYWLFLTILRFSQEWLRLGHWRTCPQYRSHNFCLWTWCWSRFIKREKGAIRGFVPSFEWLWFLIGFMNCAACFNSVFRKICEHPKENRICSTEPCKGIWVAWRLSGIFHPFNLTPMFSERWSVLGKLHWALVCQALWFVTTVSHRKLLVECSQKF